MNYRDTLFDPMKHLLLALAFLCLSVSAPASTVWIFSGTASGTLGEAEFTDAEFSFTASSDSPGEDVGFEVSAVLWVLDSPPTINILGLGSAVWEVGLELVETAFFGYVGVYVSDGGDSLFSISRQVSSEPSEPWSAWEGAGPIPTDRGELDFTSFGPVTLTTGIPEPSTSVLGALAALCVLRRRVRS